MNLVECINTANHLMTVLETAAKEGHRELYDQTMKAYKIILKEFCTLKGEKHVSER